MKNVVGVLEGNGPLADETVVIGAHYDHVGYGSFGSLGGKDAKGKIHYGADDNASGTTGLIELARRFGAMKDRQGRRIVFIAFTAEERGLYGSIHYCKEPLFPLDKTAAMINMDMIGRTKPVPGRLARRLGQEGPARRLRHRHRATRSTNSSTTSNAKTDFKLSTHRRGHRPERPRLVLPQEGAGALPLHRHARRVPPPDRRAGEDQRRRDEEGGGLRAGARPTNLDRGRDASRSTRPPATRGATRPTPATRVLVAADGPAARHPAGQLRERGRRRAGGGRHPRRRGREGRASRTTTSSSRSAASR